jgi:hypothetical protein
LSRKIGISSLRTSWRVAPRQTDDVGENSRSRAAKHVPQIFIISHGLIPGREVLTGGPRAERLR